MSGLGVHFYHYITFIPIKYIQQHGCLKGGVSSKSCSRYIKSYQARGEKGGNRMRVSLHFQRSSDRLRLICPIMYSGMPAIGEGLVLNLSPYGCTVETARSVLNGCHMRLRIFLSDSHSSLHIELAAVRWVRESYFGAEFLRIPDHDRSRLDRYLNDFRIHFSNVSSPL